MGRPPTAPTPATLSQPKDWSSFVTKPLRKYLKKPCPTCGAKALSPCRNMMALWGQVSKNRKTKRKRRWAYQAYVHAARKR